MEHETQKLIDGIYAVKNGELTKLESDDMPKIKLTADALDAIKSFQNGLRQSMGGYRPDLVLIASSLLTWACTQEQAPSVVKDYGKQIFA